MWVVAFESPFSCPESVNIILEQNLERINRKASAARAGGRKLCEGQQSELRHE
jgi:hypothetical protein